MPRDIEIISMNRNQEIGKGLSSKIAKPKLAPDCLFSPHWEFKNMIMNAKNRIVRFQIIKLCCKVVHINNFKRQSCSGICLEKTLKMFAKLLIVYAFFNDFKAPPHCDSHTSGARAYRCSA